MHTSMQAHPVGDWDEQSGGEGRRERLKRRAAAAEARGMCRRREGKEYWGFGLERVTKRHTWRVLPAVSPCWLSLAPFLVQGDSMRPDSGLRHPSLVI